MKININYPHITLKKTSIENLPDFVVITGENGSGKTQLLNYIAEGDMYGVEETDAEGNFVHKPGCELIIDGNRETNISLVGVNQHRINLGEQINENTIVTK
jgi:ABC-type molybdenum transport system ATPase subunit/photorepair protein PhrA